MLVAGRIETNWYVYMLLKQELLYGVVVSIRASRYSTTEEN